MNKIQIQLTSRPRVSIVEDDWPIIAETWANDHDGEIIEQANRVSSWAIKVRQHTDGRALVYATYDYNTNFPDKRDYHAHAGELLDDDDDIIERIESVIKEISNIEHYDTDVSRWPELQADIISELPAVELV